MENAFNLDLLDGLSVHALIRAVAKQVAAEVRAELDGDGGGATVKQRLLTVERAATYHDLTFNAEAVQYRRHGTEEKKSRRRRTRQAGWEEERERPNGEDDAGAAQQRGEKCGPLQVETEAQIAKRE